MCFAKTFVTILGSNLVACMHVEPSEGKGGDESCQRKIGGQSGLVGEGGPSLEAASET